MSDHTHVVETATGQCVFSGCNYATHLTTLTTTQQRRHVNVYGHPPPGFVDITGTKAAILGDDIIWSRVRREWQRVDEAAGGAWPWMRVSDFEPAIKCARQHTRMRETLWK